MNEPLNEAQQKLLNQYIVEDDIEDTLFNQLELADDKNIPLDVMQKEFKKTKSKLNKLMKNEKKENKTLAVSKSKATKEKKEDCELLGSFMVDPTKRAVLAIRTLYKNEEISLKALKQELMKQQEILANGSTSHLEEILHNQIKVLENLFYYASERVGLCDNLNEIQAYVDLAVKSNNSCRKTISALQHLKNPNSPTFIRQQNNALAQQVNHFRPVSKNPKNELLEVKKNEWLDTRTPTTTSIANSVVEPMEACGSENR